MPSVPTPPPTRPVPARANVLGRTEIDSSFNAYAASTSGKAQQSVGGGGSSFSPYPSVFRDLSNLDMPTDMQGLFAVCRYLSQWSPVHKAFVQMMSTFPITDLVIKPLKGSSDVLRNAIEDGPGADTSGEDAAVDRIVDLAKNHWRLKKAGQKAARHYFTYSNAVCIISYPFQKMLKCAKKGCGHTAQAARSKWVLRPGGKFNWECEKCGKQGDAIVWDQFLSIPEDVRLIPLDMERIDTVHNDFRDATDFYYRIPEDTIDRLKSSPLDKEFVCKTPQAYLEAALGKMAFPGFKQDNVPRVKLLEGSFFVLKAASLSHENNGLAFPEFAATLKDYWLERSLKKSQEAIASELFMPRRFIYPESKNASASIFELVSVPSFMGILKNEAVIQRQDPGYISVVPFPVGVANIGGEAKLLNMAQEIRVQMEMETAGLSVPIEAIFGGLQFSGASVSLQQVQARFEDFRDDLLQLYRWFLNHVVSTMSLIPVIAELRKFRMGEDIPYLQMLASLQAQGRISLRRLHDAMNIDTDSEREEIRGDQRFDATLAELRSKADVGAQSELMLRQMTAQAEGQIAGLETQLDARAELAKKVRNDPELYDLVRQDSNLVFQIFGSASPEAYALNGGATQQQAMLGQDPMGGEVGQEEPGQGMSIDDIKAFLRDGVDAPDMDTYLDASRSGADFQTLRQALQSGGMADDFEERAVEATPTRYRPGNAGAMH